MALTGKTDFPLGGSNDRSTLQKFYHVPLVGSQMMPVVGNLFYVSSTLGSSTGPGYTPHNAYATIDQAIGACTAGNGDVIVVLPGHVDTVVGAAGIALDVAGVTIIGIGSGHSRPQVNFTTAAAASCDISAANCRVENIWFNCAIDDQTAMVNVTAADVTIHNCEFMIADATYDGDIGILASAAADRLVVSSCHFYATGNTTVAAAISCGATDNTVIRDNIIMGYHGTAGAIINSAAAVNFHAIGNFIVNRTADGNNKAIVLHASTVGIVANNRMAVIDSTGPAPVTAAAAFVSGNYFTGAVDVTASTLM